MINHQFQDNDIEIIKLTQAVDTIAEQIGIEKDKKTISKLLFVATYLSDRLYNLFLINRDILNAQQEKINQDF